MKRMGVFLSLFVGCYLFCAPRAAQHPGSAVYLAQKQLRLYKSTCNYSDIVKRLEVAIALYLSQQSKDALQPERIKLYSIMTEKEAQTRAEQLAFRLYLRELQKALQDTASALGMLKALRVELAAASDTEKKVELEKIIDTFLAHVEEQLLVISNLYAALAHERLPTRYKETNGAPASGV